ncbi:hypothetical protein PHAVU_007G059000 [Phaseolus vulgaris]|uniref:Uncharacterized protein n=1 Tax=Phaseolus vulgaris TaxID=3885 RepID=V7BBN8_PHAVU|nr:hypothetical protein PHAVU_007G059000g [Phaseolus vulgaris]ESW15272.1 hypothetical protein PHAVU_007G059000g [Phaseolus vulgaris]
MANKYVALLLVVCLTVVATVEAEKYQTPCVHDCLSIKCGEHPSSFCKFLCGFGCSSAGMVNANKIKTNGEKTKTTQSSQPEAPQLSRKVQAQSEKDYKKEMQSIH